VAVVDEDPVPDTPQPSPNSGDADSDSRTVCPLCSVGCHLRRGDGSRARGVAGPANPEGRLCRKGVTAFEVADDDDRLTRPLVRRDGDLEPVTWGRALSEVVERFEAVLGAAGPDALAFLGAPYCTNEENYLLGKLARTLGTNNVDNRARRCHAESARALADRVGWPATTNGLADLGDADVVVVAGANPAQRQPVAFNSFLRPAVADGTTLVHVDPVGNETTRLADVHLSPRPGTDALVFSLLCAAVQDADGTDGAFLRERTRGFDGFADRLASLDRDRAASVAGVDDERLDRVGDLVAGADRVAAMVGTGVEGCERGLPAPDALLDLLLLTGNLGRRGTGLFVLRGLVNEQGATDAGCVPDRLPGHQPVTDPGARARVAEVWGTEPPATPGRTATELLEAFGGDVQAALVVGENPAVSKREPDWVTRRLDALDTLVVLEIAPSDTTRHADVVLPAAAGIEKAGTVTNLERRVQRTRSTVRPPGEARPDWAILTALGRQLVDGAGGSDSTGVASDRGAAFDFSDAAAVFAELTRVAPTHAGLSYADLGETGSQWPPDAEGVLYRERFGTPDGLAAFSSALPSVEPSTGEGLRLVTGGRTSEFYGDRGADDARLRIHSADAAERNVESGDSVLVSDGSATVRIAAVPDDGVRRGTVFLPATVADPFLRRDVSTVSVEPTEE